MLKFINATAKIYSTHMLHEKIFYSAKSGKIRKSTKTQIRKKKNMKILTKWKEDFVCFSWKKKEEKNLCSLWFVSFVFMDRFLSFLSFLYLSFHLNHKSFWRQPYLYRVNMVIHPPDGYTCITLHHCNTSNNIST